MLSTNQIAIRLASKAKSAAEAKSARFAPKPYLYATVFGLWLLSLVYFHPRMMMLLDISDVFVHKAALAIFVIFVEFAWLYGFFNIFVVLFNAYYKNFIKDEVKSASLEYVRPGVAFLYTTYNDFMEESVLSCVRQDYDNFTVYILDDSTDPAYRARIDAFAQTHAGRVKVVRRDNNRGFKAGNMNNALAHATRNEPYFAIADADEIVPADFLKKLVATLEANPQYGFAQANHRCNPAAKSQLSKVMGVGIDIHWKWYQPLRNKFGFVMFLGHGAVIRRKCWEVVGGFPEIVSEDLAFAIRVREHGWRGRFVEDVVCYEEFPESVKAFRIRHMKWTRGTCEFLWREGPRLLRSKGISLAEKLDILFPTLNLPLTLLYFLFMIDANVLLPLFFSSEQPLTLVMAGQEVVVPVFQLSAGFNAIYSPDFFAITLLTFFAPVLCFLIELWRRPVFLFKFLCKSTALYAALSPLSAIGVSSFLITRKATFLVTGDKSSMTSYKTTFRALPVLKKMRQGFSQFFKRSHPDQLSVQAFEILTGAFLAVTCIMMFQLSFLGLTLAFMLMPLMHRLPWENRLIRGMTYVPFTLIIVGFALSGMSMLGLQTTFFAYGFHF